MIKMALKIIAILLSISLFILPLGSFSESLNDLRDDPNPNHFDVIVIGGEPEGVAASVSAARNGAKTLLVEHRDGLGGLLTYGYLNQLDLGYDKDRRLANQGIFYEWYRKVGKKANFDVELAKNEFLLMVQRERNIKILLNTTVVDILMEGNTIVGVVLDTPDGEQAYYAERFIDTTSEAELATKAGAPYFMGQEDSGLPNAMMAVTLVMLLENIDWRKMRRAANDGVLGGAKVHRNIAWGFPEVPQRYKAIEENTRVRGLNIGMQSNGLVTINALQIFEVDGTDPDSIANGIERGKKETQNFVTFLREQLPGFENAEIAEYPTDLYIRETRHIRSEYQLSIVDVWENKDHWDSIGFGAYPVDVQATNVHSYGTVITAPTQYAIPFRSLVPLEVENLLVASKSSGYSSLAAGSARTVPIGMTTAEAAGVAAMISIKENISFRDMSKNKDVIQELQKRLKSQGANLYSFTLPYPYQGEWFYPALKTLLPYGLIAGGYDNDLKVDQTMTEAEFLRIFSAMMNRVDKEKYQKLATYFNPWLESQQEQTKGTPLTRDQAAEYFLKFFGYSLKHDLWAEAIKHRLVDQTMLEGLESNSEISNAEGFHMIAHIIHLLNEGRFDHILVLGEPKVGYIDVYNDTVMVPIRLMRDELGVTYDWDSSTQILVIRKEDNMVELEIGSNIAVINGVQVALDAEPTIAMGSSYIPLIAVGEALNIKVDYLMDKSVVVIYSEDKEIEVDVRKR
jgi:hypothetical protein